jgi:hypothetical protein
MFLTLFKGLHALAVQAIKDAETLTEPVSYSGMTNLRRLYEDIPMPGGLAVVGDSLAGFNPVLTTASLNLLHKESCVVVHLMFPKAFMSFLASLHAYLEGVARSMFRGHALRIST